MFLYYEFCYYKNASGLLPQLYPPGWSQVSLKPNAKGFRMRLGRTFSFPSDLVVVVLVYVGCVCAYWLAINDMGSNVRCAVCRLLYAVCCVPRAGCWVLRVVCRVLRVRRCGWTAAMARCGRPSAPTGSRLCYGT